MFAEPFSHEDHENKVFECLVEAGMESVAFSKAAGRRQFGDALGSAQVPAPLRPCVRSLCAALALLAAALQRVAHLFTAPSPAAHAAGALRGRLWPCHATLARRRANGSAAGP